MLLQVTADLRHSSKENVYALLYGMGPARLADKLGITDREAAELRQALLAALPGIQAWMGRVLEECERTGELAGSEWSSGRGRQAVRACHLACQYEEAQHQCLLLLLDSASRLW